MTTFSENIRKMMGWCPSVNSWTFRKEPALEFVNQQISPINGGTKAEPIQSDNVIFPANGSLFNLCTLIGFSLLLNLSRHLDYPVLLIGGIAMCILVYFLTVKSFQSSISIDENGVHYNSFRLRDITLNYSDIKSIKSVKWDRNNNSKKTWVLMAVFILILALLVFTKEWKVFVVAAPMLPVILMLEKEQESRYFGLDTRLYIEPRKNNWWYELSQYYSIITDKKTADRIRASIEQNMGGA